MVDMTSYVSRNDLLKMYSEFHTKDGGNNNQRDLYASGCKFLSSTAPEKRFMELGINLYRLLRKRVDKFDGHTADIMLVIKEGFVFLEKYALNLWKFPWRKEFHVIKVRAFICWICLLCTGWFSSKGPTKIIL